jgi:hypothetical protein
MENLAIGTVDVGRSDLDNHERLPFFEPPSRDVEIITLLHVLQRRRMHQNPARRRSAAVRAVVMRLCVIGFM